MHSFKPYSTCLSPRIEKKYPLLSKRNQVYGTFAFHRLHMVLSISVKKARVGGIKIKINVKLLTVV